jgi:hypothetical protein
VSEKETTDREVIQNGIVWGYMSGETFIPLPKAPLVLGGYEAPCDVTLPDGRVRHVIVKPV